VRLDGIDLADIDLYTNGDAHLVWQTLRAERPVAGHPLGTALSLYHQNNTIGPAGAAPGPAAPDQRRSHRPMSPREWLLHWIDLEPSPQVRYHYLAEMLRHLSAAWTRRGEPNVVLLHYEDLSADLEGEMRRLAARLGIAVPDAIWPGMVEVATF
jgi:hypothetical protein